MASQLTALGRRRKADLRELKVYSRRLDAAQEKLEREITRLINRKRSLPELADYQRLSQMAEQVDSAVASFASALYSMGITWSTL